MFYVDYIDFYIDYFRLDVICLFLVLVPPDIDDTHLDSAPKVIEGKPVTLDCPATGLPFPTITWLQDGEPLPDSPRFRVLRSGRQLAISDTIPSDSKRYTCVANNVAGESKKDFILKVLGKYRHTLVEFTLT